MQRILQLEKDFKLLSFLTFLFLLGDCTVDPLCVVGDDCVESRLFAGATFLPSIRGYSHSNAVV